MSPKSSVQNVDSAFVSALVVAIDVVVVIYRPLFSAASKILLLNRFVKMLKVESIRSSRFDIDGDGRVDFLNFLQFFFSKVCIEFVLLLFQFNLTFEPS